VGHSLSRSEGKGCAEDYTVKAGLRAVPLGLCFAKVGRKIGRFLISEKEAIRGLELYAKRCLDCDHDGAGLVQGC
jgi:hypothetical protein